MTLVPRDMLSAQTLQGPKQAFLFLGESMCQNYLAQHVDTSIEPNHELGANEGESLVVVQRFQHQVGKRIYLPLT